MIYKVTNILSNLSIKDPLRNEEYLKALSLKGRAEGQVGGEARGGARAR